MADEEDIPEDGELVEEQLEDVAGGVLSDINLKIGQDIQSSDDKHDKWTDLGDDDPPPKSG